MTGGQKFTRGIILQVVGLFMLFIGAILTSTLFGACLGIPLILVAIAMIIWGSVHVFQGHFQRQQEAIELGVQRGLQQGLVGVPTSQQPPVAPIGTPSGKTTQTDARTNAVLADVEADRGHTGERVQMPQDLGLICAACGKASPANHRYCTACGQAIQQ